jgi:hypothetical protein
MGKLIAILLALLAVCVFFIIAPARPAAHVYLVTDLGTVPQLSFFWDFVFPILFIGMGLLGVAYILFQQVKVRLDYRREEKERRQQAAREKRELEIKANQVMWERVEALKKFYAERTGDEEEWLDRNESDPADQKFNFVIKPGLTGNYLFPDRLMVETRKDIARWEATKDLKKSIDEWRGDENEWLRRNRSSPYFRELHKMCDSIWLKRHPAVEAELFAGYRSTLVRESSGQRR